MNKEEKIKKLLYQSSHRGCKETDVILGPFAQKYLLNFSDEELALYEKFINEDDWDIYNWVVSGNFPEEYRGRIRELLAEMFPLG